MKCKNCPALETEGYEYPEEYCSIGVDDDDLVEYPDGKYGCKLHYKTVAKRVSENAKLWKNSASDITKEDATWWENLAKELTEKEVNNKC